MLRPNRTAIDHLNVILRKTRRHCMSDMVAVVAKQQYRADHLWRLRLDHQHQVREDFAKRRVSGDHLLDAQLLQAKWFVILPCSPNDVRRGDGRPYGRHFLSLRSSKVSLLLIGHLVCAPWAAILRLARNESHIQRECSLTVAVERVRMRPTYTTTNLRK